MFDLNLKDETGSGDKINFVYSSVMLCRGRMGVTLYSVMLCRHREGGRRGRSVGGYPRPMKMRAGKI